MLFYAHVRNFTLGSHENGQGSTQHHTQSYKKLHPGVVISCELKLTMWSVVLPMDFTLSLMLTNKILCSYFRYYFKYFFSSFFSSLSQWQRHTIYRLPWNMYPLLGSGVHPRDKLCELKVAAWWSFNVSWWRHDNTRFFHYQPSPRGIQRSLVDSHEKALILAWKSYVIYIYIYQ